MTPTEEPSISTSLDMPGLVDSGRADRDERPTLSVVSTMYRSEEFLDEFIPRVVSAIAACGIRRYEIILVNDGSPDGSCPKALSLQDSTPFLHVVDLSRNFGHHYAMVAGLSVSRGARVFLIDCDLEVGPEVLVDLQRSMNENRCDLVYCQQEERKGGWFERVSGGVFWKGFNLLSETRIPENICTERLMTREFVDALLKMGDRNLFLAGMMQWTGFRQCALPIRKGLRDGASTYTLVRRLQLMVNAVTSFSARPLTLLFHAGLTVTLISTIYGFYLIVRKVLYDDALTGFTSLATLTLFSLGIITAALGLLGVYVGKIYSQVQNRPLFLIRDVHWGRVRGADDSSRVAGPEYAPIDRERSEGMPAGERGKATP